jgi:outer membrane protein assembly complex protein YaeT
VANADVLDYVGRPVASVHLTVDGRDTTEPALIRVVDVQVGKPFAMRDVRETVLHLYALGRFDDVRVDATVQPGAPAAAVNVRFDLISTRPISAIQFAGIAGVAGIDEGQLRRAVTERAGPSPPVARADELSRVVEATLRTYGYLHARATPRIVPNGGSHSALVFDIEPGMRATIGTITVNGPDTAQRELLAALQATTGAPYERDALNTRIAKYLRDRRSQGYYEAKVNLTDEAVAGERFNLTFTVDPGRHVRVVFSGDSVSGDRHDLVPVEREGSVDEDLLEDSTARIEDALKAQGYKDAMAPHERTEVGGELVITFHVTRGQQYRIADVTIAGNTSVPSADLQIPPRLGDGQPFSQAAVDAEASAIEDVYRRAGFSAAKADVDVKMQPPTSGYVPVAVTFTVREGIRTLVGSITVSGNRAIPTPALLTGLRLQQGRPYVVTSLAADRDAILVKYLNAGYENATIEARPEPNRDRTETNIAYSVREGPQVIIDHVLIIGPQHTDASIVEKQLQLHAGDPLSRDAVLDTQRRLQSLGLYRNVTISELRHGEESRRDLLVSVEEGPSRSIATGGGFELARRVEQSDTSAAAEEVFDAAPRGSFEISWRNLFGTNRSTSVFSSITLHPHGVEQRITEYRVVNTWREPKVFNTPIDGLVTLLVEQQFRSSFNFRRQSATAEATRRFSNHISLIGTYQIQHTNVFDVTADQNLIDRVFPNVRLSSFSLSAVRDTRNDQIDPTRGQYFSVYGQLAGKAIGGEVGFFKSFFRASAFRLLPGPRGIVLAGNVFLGLATGFPQQNPDGSTIIDPVRGGPARDLPQSERFYAGGDTTMRGFAVDQLGVRHIPSGPNDTIDTNGFPLGGNAEMLYNIELRVPLKGQLETHGFLDTGNVFKRVIDLDFREVRSAVGFGVLYKSPIGPLRFDLGFKVNPLPDESLTAFFVTFGRAF